METGKPAIWSRVQPHGGTTVPLEIREKLSLKPGDILIWQYDLEDKVRVSKGNVKEVSVEWPHKTSQ